MALSASTIWEIETTGDDTNNGGAFDPSQTAGMFTDGAATSATGASPVFSSASYNFVAGDVGAWVYIASGTNWTPGWYKIASVAANAATLSAAIGAGVIKSTLFSVPHAGAPTTLLGCATTASPTGATWTVDYSQQAAAKYAYTDLASVGAGLTVSSAAKPFAKEQVGNSIVITGGTNFTTGRWVIASVAAGVATLVGAANVTTGAGVNGTGGQGGALASIGQAGAHILANHQVFIKTGTYTIASASTNIATGCLSSAGASLQIEGYSAVRGDLRTIGTTTRPTLVASGISTFTLLTSGSAWLVANLILDGGSLTSSRGVNTTLGMVYNCKGQNFTNAAFTGSCDMVSCWATGCSTAAAISQSGLCVACVASANTISGFSGGNYAYCLSINNTGGSSSGFLFGNATNLAVNCVAYGNGSTGYTASGNAATMVNCIAEANTGVGFTLSGGSHIALNCATYNNTGGAITATSLIFHSAELGMITGSGSFFTNAAGADFSLNNTAGAGALLRATGYPGALPTGGTGYLDVGALQHACPTGSTGMMLV